MMNLNKIVRRNPRLFGFVLLLFMAWIYPHVRPLWPVPAALVGVLWGFVLSGDMTYKGYMFSLLTGSVGFMTLGLAGGILIPDFILILALGGGAAFLNVPGRLSSNDPDIADRIIQRFFVGLYRFAISIGSGLLFGCLCLMLRIAPHFRDSGEGLTPVIHSFVLFAGMISFMIGSVLLFDEYYQRRKLLTQ